jgi:hypothetical protein
MKKGLIALFVLLLTFFVGCDPELNDGNTASTNKEERVKFSKGKINGNVYTNNMLGFTFTRPKSWVYLTDEELAAVINVLPSYLGDNFDQAVMNNAVVFDMMVKDSFTGTNINVGYENLYKTYASNITIEQYIDAVKMQFANIPTITTTFSDTYETVRLGKTEFTRVICNTTAQGKSMTQVYYLHKIDHYMCNIVVTILGNYTISEIEAMFK